MPQVRLKFPNYDPLRKIWAKPTTASNFWTTKNRHKTFDRCLIWIKWMRQSEWWYYFIVQCKCRTSISTFKGRRKCLNYPDIADYKAATCFWMLPGNHGRPFERWCVSFVLLIATEILCFPIIDSWKIVSFTARIKASDANSHLTALTSELKFLVLISANCWSKKRQSIIPSALYRNSYVNDL